MKGWIVLVAMLGIGCARSSGRPPGEPELARDQIRAPHAVHAQAQVKCITCHEAVYDETTLRSVPEALPDEDTCLGCHRAEKEKGNCGFCHTDVKLATKRILKDTPLRMSHAQHIELTKEDCSTCHKTLPEPFASPHTIPKMANCLTCHGHADEYAQARCTGCHPSIAKMALVPLSDFSHQGEVIRRHGADARSSAETCAQCHDQTFCADCHAKTVSTRVELKFPEAVAANFIHRNDFVTRHSVEAAANPAMCQRCHGTTFCTSCHAAQNLTPLAQNPRDPHPPGWSLPGTAEFHGPAARRDIASCASCHDQGAQSNCVGCHRVGGLGGNPHPASWLAHHDHNEIRGNGMCATCHL